MHYEGRMDRCLTIASVHLAGWAKIGRDFKKEILFNSAVIIVIIIILLSSPKRKGGPRSYLFLPVHSSCWSWWQARPDLAHSGSGASSSTPSGSPSQSWTSLMGLAGRHPNLKRWTFLAASWFGIVPTHDFVHVFSDCRFPVYSHLRCLVLRCCHFGIERTTSGFRSSRNTESLRTSWQCRSEEGGFPLPADRTPLVWATGS